MKLGINEKALYTTKNVVDVTKHTNNLSDNKLQGTLTITNLRVIFQRDTDPSINGIIGFKTIQKIITGIIQKQENPNSLVKLQTQTLIFEAEYKDKTYRITYLPRGSRQIFEIIQTIYRNYDSTRAYRDIIEGTRLLDKEYINQNYSTIFVDLNQEKDKQKPQKCNIRLTNYRIIIIRDQINEDGISIPYISINLIQLINSTILIESSYQYKFTMQFVNNQQMYDLILQNIQEARKEMDYGINIQFKGNQQNNDDIEELNMNYDNKQSQQFDIQKYIQIQNNDKEQIEIICNTKYGLACANDLDL